MVLSDVDKMEIIYKYKKLKKSIRDIAEEMKINKNTVVLWINRYNDNETIKRKRRPRQIKLNFDNNIN